MRAAGIDLSKWNISYNPQTALLKPDFVCQRTSYGMRVDEKFNEIYPGVLTIPVRGAYHYMSSAIGWKLQADFFLSLVTPKNYHFYVCDFEGAFNQLSVNFAAEAIEWMRYVRAMTGKKVVIYSNISTYSSYLSRDSRITEFPFWISWPPSGSYDSQVLTPAMPSQRSDWLFWQHAFGEHNTMGRSYGVGGIGVDLDVFNGTVQELYRWAGVEAVLPPVQLSDSERIDRIERSLLAHGVELK